MLFVCKFLLNYRNTVHCTACKSSAELHSNFNNKYDLILKQFTKINSISEKTEPVETKKVFNDKKNQILRLEIMCWQGVTIIENNR